MDAFFYGNCRALLREAWKGDRPSKLREFLSYAAHAVINERGVALVQKSPLDSPEVAFEAALTELPRLKAITLTCQAALHVCSVGGYGFGLRGIAGTTPETWPVLVRDRGLSKGIFARASRRPLGGVSPLANCTGFRPMALRTRRWSDFRPGWRPGESSHYRRFWKGNRAIASSFEVVLHTLISEVM